MVRWSYPMHILSFSIDDDYIDRLHHFFTSLVLIVCILASSKRQYFGKPISCWTPKIFTRAHTEYAEDVCWVKNTYFLPMADPVPLDPGERGQSHVVGYYQWVPFVLLGQAILFQFPNFVWSTMHDKSGFRLRHIVESACSENVDPDTRRELARSIAVHIADYIRMRQEGRLNTRLQRAKACVARYVPLVCSRNAGNFLCAFYLLSKLLYLANLASQLLFMTAFLGSGAGHPFYGFEVLANLSLGRHWEASGQFPRVTLCDFRIRMMGNLHRHTVQCVLPINRINEKIFLLLWLWFALLGVVTVVNLVRWVGRLYSRRIRLHLVRQLLDYVGGLRERREAGPPLPDGHWMVNDFLDRYLLMDGVLILHLLAHNAGQLITSEIVTELWRFHEKEVRKKGSGRAEEGDSDYTSVYNCPLSVRETVPRRRSRLGPEGDCVTPDVAIL